MYNVNKWQELYFPHTNFEQSKHNATVLPEKYNVNLEKLDEGIGSVLDKHNMIPYTIGDFKIPGYYGLCFKTKPNSENPLGEGLTSNIWTNNSADSPIDSNYTEKTDAWFSYLDEIVEKFNGQVTQIRLIKLEAGHNLFSKDETPHIDYPWYRGIRLHICITPGIDYVWKVLGNDYHYTRSNSMIYLDTGKPHGAINSHNNKDRYILNFNLIPNLNNHIDNQIKNNII